MEAVVLGISPGTRAVGIAILCDGKLRPWSIHTDNAAVLTAASSAIRAYDVTHISILDSHVRRKFPRQERLTHDIRTLAETKAIPVSVHTTYELRRILPGGHRNKKDLFQRLVELFPELCAPYHKYLREHNSYWSKLFEAVACAYVTTL